MEETRQSAREQRRAAARVRARQQHRTLFVALTAALLGALLIGGGAWAIAKRTPKTHRVDAPAQAQAKTRTLDSDTASLSADASAAASAAGPVEVPDVVNMTLDEAKVVLGGAGLKVAVSETGAPVAAGAKRSVLEQNPAAGSMATGGDTVTIVVPAVATASKRTYVVVIDPGHQEHTDNSLEPIGPGSKTMVLAVKGGATGRTTKIPEYEFNLQISMNLKARLEALGVKVVMTRTTNDVNLSNSERAKIANKAKADLFVRIHCDGSTDTSKSGISTLFPGDTQWTKAIMAPSKAAAQLTQAAVVKSTGAVDGGIVARTDLTGFNWATVPSILVECGFISNAVEDKLLASPHYQDKVAQGITDGVMAYLNRSAR